MIKVFIVTLLASLFLLSTPASAHVLVTDSTSSQGAILHIIPDDNPIAGQESTLYFDTQQGLVVPERTTATLVITDSTGHSAPITPTLDGSLVTASYTFPTQGVYRLTYTITTNGTASVFEYSQRVSRGTQGSVLDTPSYVWAEMLMVTSLAGLIVTISVAVVRRKAIAKQSAL